MQTPSGLSRALRERQIPVRGAPAWRSTGSRGLEGRTKDLTMHFLTSARSSASPRRRTATSARSVAPAHPRGVPMTMDQEFSSSSERRPIEGGSGTGGSAARPKAFGTEISAGSEGGAGDGKLFVESGVVEQLIGLGTGTEDARPQPSPHALELLITPA